MQPPPAKDMTVSVLVWLDNTLRITETLGVSSDKVIYNHELLAMYMIRDPLQKSILSLLSKEVSLLRPMDDNQILLHAYLPHHSINRLPGILWLQ